MQLVVEAGDDTEIAAAAAQAPVQVGILFRAGRAELAIRGDDLKRAHVVAGQPELAHQASLAAAESQASDTRVRCGAQWRNHSG